MIRGIVFPTEAFNPVQTAVKAFRQHIMPDPACAIGSV